MRIILRHRLENLIRDQIWQDLKLPMRDDRVEFFVVVAPAVVVVDASLVVVVVVEVVVVVVEVVLVVI